MENPVVLESGRSSKNQSFRNGLRQDDVFDAINFDYLKYILRSRIY